ncbi:MAG: WD40/YVTN/BNR-like repeat-containing protein, partial [Thermoanaerobaculia bacterium]
MRFLSVLCAVAALAGPAPLQPPDPSLFSGMRWRLIGPFRGGRALSAAGVPGEPDHFYFGAVGGGVWETKNAGRTWAPIFDSQPIASIGAIAVAPSRPKTLYVGSGEADMRSDISHGNGVYKSLDGGRTWACVGLSDTRQIGKILVDPRDPDRVFVAALGHGYGPNSERGVFRSRDGGKTWSRVLFKDEHTGAIDLAFSPGNTRTIFAALWQTRRPPWNVYAPSNGPGSGLHRSDDGGDTWKPVRGSGLPEEKLGRIGLAFAPSDPARLYAMVDAKEGGLYASRDGGATWKRASSDPRIWGRGWYFAGVTVDPGNADVVFACNTSIYRSTDGGATFLPMKGDPTGDDFHELWIDPANPRRMITASDQGTVISVDGGETWSSWYNQPTAQLYHVITDDRFPYWVYGAQQDSGAVAVPSRTDYPSIMLRDWRPIAAGGESGTIAPDPTDSNIVSGGTVGRFDSTTLGEQDLNPVLAHPGDYRGEWTLPLTFSPRNPKALYFGNQFLFRTTDGGRHWSKISPDLTRDAPGAPET